MKNFILTLLTLITFVSYSQQLSDQGTVYLDSLVTVTAGTVSSGNTYTYTICATDGYNLHHVELYFSAFDIPSQSNLYVYDGDNINAPLLASYNNTNFSSNQNIFASCSNLSGCLTLVLDVQDTSVSLTATINYKFCCQDFNINYTSNPTALNNNIDLCPGEDFTINVTPEFTTQTALDSLGHNWGYSQTSSNITYNWDLNDGTSANTQSITHIYDQSTPQAYMPSVVLTDSYECINNNTVFPIVRMSLFPNFNSTVANPWTLCQGDTVTLEGVANSSTFAGIIDSNWQYTINPTHDSVMFIPDGSGVSYTTSITYDIFEQGSIITNINQLQGIWVSMEHSYMGDLSISITCPNGQYVILHQQGGGGTFLGVPIDDDSDLSMGTCWDYGWTEAGTQTWEQASGSYSTLPSGEYAPVDALSGLIGCPLNGNWTLIISDQWASDNGYLCSWGIEWGDSLYPIVGSYNMSYNPISWTAPSVNGEISSGGSNSDIAVGTYNNLGITAPETRPFVYTIQDNFGCTYDTTINVTWLEDGRNLCDPNYITENNIENNINIFPNPTSNNIYIELKTYEKGEIKIFNAFGKLVLNQQISSKTLNIDVSMLDNGIYLVKTDNYTCKFVKK